jgi:hypothetical protein
MPECAIDKNWSEAPMERCRRLMDDLALALTCQRPDIAAYATHLSAEMRIEVLVPAPVANSRHGPEPRVRHDDRRARH